MLSEQMNSQVIADPRFSDPMCQRGNLIMAPGCVGLAQPGRAIIKPAERRLVGSAAWAEGVGGNVWVDLFLK